MTGTLYIVATPIGNLSDITFRAIEILRSVDAVLSEDTRVGSKLLKRYDLNKPLIGYHQHSNDLRKLEILRRLSDGENLALITDAGTPGISDPGNELISYIVESLPDAKIVPIPGPSGLTSALSVSGFDVSRFIFVGFLPKKKRTKLFNFLNESELSFAYFDSPHRAAKNLADLSQVLGKERRVCVCRELTKAFETIYRGTLESVGDTLSKAKVKGEVVVVVEGK